MRRLGEPRPCEQTEIYIPQTCQPGPSKSLQPELLTFRANVSRHPSMIFTGCPIDGEVSRKTVPTPAQLLSTTRLLAGVQLRTESLAAKIGGSSG